MIKNIKDAIAFQIIKNKIKNQKREGQTFQKFLSQSYNILVLMPSVEEDFKHSVIVLEYLEKREKVLDIVTYDFRVSMLPSRLKMKVIEHGIKDVNKIGLPSKQFIKKFEDKNYSAVIDLNRESDIFYKGLTVFAPAPVKAGFSNKDSDQFYNLQVVPDENAEISYKNFLNCLTLF
jgi:hypothetical protein